MTRMTKRSPIRRLLFVMRYFIILLGNGYHGGLFLGLILKSPGGFR